MSAMNRSATNDFQLETGNCHLIRERPDTLVPVAASMLNEPRADCRDRLTRHPPHASAAATWLLRANHDDLIIYRFDSLNRSGKSLGLIFQLHISYRAS